MLLIKTAMKHSNKNMNANKSQLEKPVKDCKGNHETMIKDTEAVSQRCSVKKVLLKISQNS